MNIQEFSHQLAREERPSELLRALRTLRGENVERLRLWRRVGGGDWGVWTGGEPDDCAGQAGRCG